MVDLSSADAYGVSGPTWVLAVVNVDIAIEHGPFIDGLLRFMMVYDGLPIQNSDFL